MGESRTDAQAKLALVRNQALFGRLQANKVPALLTARRMVGSFCGLDCHPWRLPHPRDNVKPTY